MIFRVFFFTTYLMLTSLMPSCSEEKLAEKTTSSIYSVNFIPKTQLPYFDSGEPKKLGGHVIGTCFFVSPKVFVTAYHTISEVRQTSKIYLQNDSGTHWDVEIVRVNKEWDLAIGISRDSNPTYLEPSLSLNPEGTTGLAVGYPEVPGFFEESSIQKVDGSFVLLENNTRYHTKELSVIRVKEHPSDVPRPALFNMDLAGLKTIVVSDTLNSGYSGGPLLDEKGRYFGILLMAQWDKSNSAPDAFKELLVIDVSNLWRVLYNQKRTSKE